MLQKSKSIFLPLPKVDLLVAISPTPFSWSRSLTFTHSLFYCCTNKLKHSLSITNLALQPANSNNSDEGHQQEGQTMVRQLKLSRKFRSTQIEVDNISETPIELSTEGSSWCVYLIASTNPPFKTYVGVTTDFSRRLKQHNGELKGGAKASRAGRPWICACLVQGFRSRSEACEFESKWKTISRKLPRKQKSEGEEGLEDKGRVLLLQHRHAAIEKLKHSIDSGHLEVSWQLNPS